MPLQPKKALPNQKTFGFDSTGAEQTVTAVTLDFGNENGAASSSRRHRLPG
jgi:hypothetical protein